MATIRLESHQQVRPQRETGDAIDWRMRAACLDEDPELFFPIGESGRYDAQIEAAKTVCRRCDVRDVCLRWAIDSAQDYGVWGGMSEDERRRERRSAGRRKTTPRQPDPRRVAAKPHPPCAECGAPMPVPSHIAPSDWAKRVYCSRSCASSAGNRRRWAS